MAFARERYALMQDSIATGGDDADDIDQHEP